MTTPSARFGELPTLDLPSFLQFLKLKNFPYITYPSVHEPQRAINDTLFIYGPGYDKSQTSFDVDCLKIQMYLKFCGIEFITEDINEPASSPSGKLPFLATVTGAVYDSQQILDWVKNTMHKEKEITPHQEREQSKAFMALCESKLRSALLFSMWLEPVNAKEITHKAYFRHNPNPLGLVLAHQKETDIVNQLLVDRDILVREEIYEDASQTLEALSIKLGDHDYFFNSSEPTMVDAVIFSHLHCILSMPMIISNQYTDEQKRQASTLHQLVRKYDNLVNYAKRIYEQYLK
ncbi:hypothetical protein BDB01DRAFT_755837 [Pilobolus umbonatus]|nr:hypothetical protein BDB01DRAFT_755837 [Pilobolus umbonatus]